MKLKPYLYNRSASWGRNSQQSKHFFPVSYSRLWLRGIVWSQWDGRRITAQSRYDRHFESSQSRRK